MWGWLLGSESRFCQQSSDSVSRARILSAEFGFCQQNSLVSIVEVGDDIVLGRGTPTRFEESWSTGVGIPSCRQAASLNHERYRLQRAATHAARLCTSGLPACAQHHMYAPATLGLRCFGTLRLAVGSAEHDRSPTTAASIAHRRSCDCRGRQGVNISRPG